MALASLLGGIDPVILTGAFAVIVAVAVLGCSLALVLSVWARRPHDVVVVVYTLWAIDPAGLSGDVAAGDVSAGRQASDWLLLADPFYLAFAPYLAPGRVGLSDFVWFFRQRLRGFGGVRADCGLADAAGLIARTDRGRRPRRTRLGRADQSLAPGPDRSTATRYSGASGVARRPSTWVTALVVMSARDHDRRVCLRCILGLEVWDRARPWYGRRGDRGHLRRNPPSDLRPLDPVSDRAIVAVGRTPAGQPRCSGR